MRVARKQRLLAAAFLLLVLAAGWAFPVLAAEGEAEYVPSMYATFWALVPPVVAIGLALITKEVYSSLFVGFW